MPPKGFDPDNAECPKCGGDVWDNRDDKASARAPDFRCKDKDTCDGRVWMEEFKKGGNGNGNGNGNGGQRNGGGRGGRGAQSNGGGNDQPQAPAKPALTKAERKATRDKIITDYFGLMKIAEERMVKIAARTGILLTMEHIQAATYSVYTKMEAKKLIEPPTEEAIAEAASGRPTPPPVAPTTRTPFVPPSARVPAGVGAREDRHPALDAEADDRPF